MHSCVASRSLYFTFLTFASMSWVRFAARVNTSNKTYIKEYWPLSYNNTVMDSNDLLSSVSKGYLLLANILSTAKIENVVVPEVAQSGTDVTLECQYYAPDDNFELLWLFNGNRSPVYKWSPRTVPEVAGVLEGHLDLLYKASRVPTEEGRALRIIQVDPRMSGDYTCVLISNGNESRQKKRMQVYTPEQEIDLIVDDQRKSSINITCIARGLFPQPDLVIEYNNEPISQQYQRVWHDKELYNAESRAQLALSKCKQVPLEIKCRLCLPQVDYTAIKKRFLRLAKNCNLAWIQKPARLYIITAITVVSNYYL